MLRHIKKCLGRKGILIGFFVLYRNQTDNKSLDRVGKHMSFSTKAEILTDIIKYLLDR